MESDDRQPQVTLEDVEVPSVQTSHGFTLLLTQEVGELSQHESSKLRVIDPSGTVMVSVELAHSGDREELAGLASMAPLLTPLFDELLRPRLASITER